MAESPEPAIRLTLSTDATEFDGLVRELREVGVATLDTSDVGFDGAVARDLIVTLTPLVIGPLAAILAARIAARRHVELKYKGLHVKGVSEAVLLQLLDRTSKPK